MEVANTLAYYDTAAIITGVKSFIVQPHPLHLICHRHKQGSLTEGERISTIDLLVLTSLDQLLFILNFFSSQQNKLS
jgi:hypothetical protein